MNKQQKLYACAENDDKISKRNAKLTRRNCRLVVFLIAKK